MLSRAADGTWLIFTCGCPHEPAAEDCTAERSWTCPGGAEPAWTTTAYSSRSLDGPWEAHVDLLGEATRAVGGVKLGSQNVSPIMKADGSVVLMFKVGVYACTVCLYVLPQCLVQYSAPL